MKRSVCGPQLGIDRKQAEEAPQLQTWLISHKKEKQQRRKPRDQRVELNSLKKQCIREQFPRSRTGHESRNICNMWSKRTGDACPAGFQNCYEPVAAMFFPFFLFLNGSPIPIFLSLSHHVLGAGRWHGRDRQLVFSVHRLPDHALPQTQVPENPHVHHDVLKW